MKYPARSLVAGVTMVLLLCSGCATTPTRQNAPVFYPPDRSTARLQYLTTISAPVDIEPAPSWLISFAAGTPPPKPGIAKPYGVDVKNGVIHICDTAVGIIHDIDLQKRRWSYFAPPGQSHFIKPINSATDDDGTRYVADSERGQVLMFDRNNEFIGTIGTSKELKPTDVALAKDRIYVTDLKSMSVRVYNKASRELLFSLPREEDKRHESDTADSANAKKDTDKKDADASDEKKKEKTVAADSLEAKPVDAKPSGDLSAPTNLALGPDGSLYVSDAGQFCVKQFDPVGKFVRIYGHQGDTRGEFARNKGIAVDRDSNLYVIDAAFQNCQIFNRDGALLMHFGDPAEGLIDSLVLPAGIAIDYDATACFRRYVAPGFDIDYVLFIVSQYGDRKINVYGFLKRPDIKP